MKHFPILDWEKFPTNENGLTIKKRLEIDCSKAIFLNIVSGYSGLDQIIWFIARKAVNANIKLIFGHEPSTTNRFNFISPKKLDRDMRDYWLNRGFSPSNNSALIDAITALKDKRVIARIHKERFLHAKAYITNEAAIFGSSNFSKPGLETSRELNCRHVKDSEGYDSVCEFFEGCWDRSDDYSDQLLKLLEELLRHVTWREALARSCAALLEGDWAKNLIPANLKEDFESLWPHQRQGIAQALTVLENQGAVVLADPTGSGKTKTGGWLLRLSWQKMLSNGGELATNLTPLMICPSSVINNWYSIFDELGFPPQVLPSGILSSGTSKSSKNRLKLIDKTNLLSVDEIHNFYGQRSNRTKKLGENFAESRIFLTATPINKEFKDLVKLVNLLGTEELDGEVFSQLSKLEEAVMSRDEVIRNNSRKKAGKIIQKFMVRRTRNDLRNMVKTRKEEYMLPSGKIADYPNYHVNEYDLDSKNDDKIIQEISVLTNELKGLSRITSMRQTNDQKENKTPEKQTLRMILNSQRALSKWSIWKMLDSSYYSLHEHLLGTLSVERKLGFKTGKNSSNSSKGVIPKLKEIKIPLWEFSEQFKKHPDVPDWLLDEGRYKESINEEIVLYEEILEYAEKLSDRRIISKINCILKVIEDNSKVLVFDTSNVTLLYIEKKLREKNIEVHTFIGSKKGKKAKKVSKAEELFGVDSDDSSRVALLSDMMSEGINLQGSSKLIHLTIPSTIKLAEQRVGRVDRMNSKYDDIEIYYPIRDALSSTMSPYLQERNKLVKDIIGSNIKLPNDEDLDDLSEEGKAILNSKELNDGMFTEKNGLFDAFHDIRELIGEDGLISTIEYDAMRTSEASTMSYIGYIKSTSAWSFFVIESKKKGVPQWVFINHDKMKTEHRGITTDTSEICSNLKQLIPNSIEIEPSAMADEIVEDYIKHLRKNQFQLLSSRRKSLLLAMNKVLLSWRNKVGHQSDFGVRLGELRMAVVGRSERHRDIRKISAKWIEYIRDNKDKIELKKTKRKKQTHLITQLSSNLPNDLESFIKSFEDIEIIPDLDSRIISMIAGIPVID
mgnify:CR=1 FL=1